MRKAYNWAAVLAVVAITTLWPAPVQAAPIALGLCKEAPVATVPSESVVARFGAHPTQAPTGADPFAENSTTTVYQEYGWPTTWWPTYDLGCGPDLARDPGAVVGGFVINLTTTATLPYATAFDSITHAVMDWTGLRGVDAAVEEVVADLREDVWKPIVGVAIAVTVLWFVLAVRKGDTADLTKAAITTIGVVFLLAIVVNYPAKSARVFDSVVKGSVSTLYSGTVGGQGDSTQKISDGVVSGVFEATMYDRWCEGIVGGDAEAAKTYCPAIWKSMYVSRFEVAELAKVTDEAERNTKRAELIKAKQNSFEATAEKMKNDHPSSYTIFQGKDYGARMFSAVAAHIVWPLVALFPFAALLVMLASLLILRVLVLLAPVFGPLLLHPGARNTGRQVLQGAGSAALNAVLFGIFSALFLRIEISIMRALSMPLAVRLILVALLSVACWQASRPLRRLFDMKKAVMKPLLAGQQKVSGKYKAMAAQIGLGAATGGPAGAATVAAQQVITTAVTPEAEVAEKTYTDLPDMHPTPPPSTTSGSSGVVTAPPKPDPPQIPRQRPAGQ